MSTAEPVLSTIPREQAIAPHLLIEISKLPYLGYKQKTKKKRTGSSFSSCCRLQISRTLLHPLPSWSPGANSGGHSRGSRDGKTSKHCLDKMIRQVAGIRCVQRSSHGRPCVRGPGSTFVVRRQPCPHQSCLSPVGQPISAGSADGVR